MAEGQEQGAECQETVHLEGEQEGDGDARGADGGLDQTWTMTQVNNAAAKGALHTGAWPRAGCSPSHAGPHR